MGNANGRGQGAAQPREPRAVVEAFFTACRVLDFDRALTFIDDDCVYENVPFHTARGKARVGRDLRLMGRALTAFDVDMVNIAADGGVVLTERVDHLSGRFFRASIPLMGAFVVEDGRITQWRDYFDWAAACGRAGTSVFGRWRR